MVKTRKSLPWLVILGLCALGLVVSALPGYRFSALVIFAVSGLVLCFQLLNLLRKRFPRFSSVASRVLMVLLCLVLVSALITGIVILNAARGTKNPSCQYLIVLGAGVNGRVPSLSLRERLDAAYDYLIAHPDTICIVSGGQGPGEDITEAECMSDWLLDKGIAPERIIREDKATTTQENLRFSVILAEEHNRGTVDAVGIVSSEYHLFRAGLMAQDQGLHPVLIPANTGWISLRINYYLREIAATWYYLIFRS